MRIVDTVLHDCCHYRHHWNEITGESEREKGVNFWEELQNRSRGNFDVALTANLLRAIKKFVDILPLRRDVVFLLCVPAREGLSIAQF